MTRAAAGLTAIALTAAVAGCGEKRETTTGGASTSPAPAVAISETEYKLTPATAKASEQSGQVSVQVKNTGGTAHALAIDVPSGEVKTKTLKPGATQTLTAQLKPGAYTIYCPIDGHRKKGMVGKLVVG